MQKRNPERQKRFQLRGRWMRYEEDLGEKGAAIINKNWTDDRHKENQLSETSEENSKMRSCIVD